MACFNLCDACSNPGHCCTGIYLNYGGHTPAVTAETTLEAMVQLASFVSEDCNERPTVGFPFQPLYKAPHGSWKLWCVNLTKDGRCGDYDNRPMLCKTYQPGQDGLCVMHTPVKVTRDEEQTLPKDA